ncbi:MAG TPA: DUF4349 domain-containing protein [Gaiellaceae bacterium]|nr:DUF4349 domain-containing protein [Gaiellaceae bacterium]
MSAYELGAGRLEELLRGEEPRTQAEERHVALFAELRSGALHAPDSLRSRVLASAPAARRTWTFRRPPRRLVLVAVPLALAAAVTAAVVHGIVGSRSPLAAENAPVLGVGAVPARPDTTARSVVTHGTQHSPAYSAEKQVAVAGGTVLSNLQQSLSNLQQSFDAPALAGSSGRLVHADAQLAVQEDGAAALSGATSHATQIVSSLGGFAQSVNYVTAHDGSGSAFLQLRVPVGKVQKAVNQLSGLGTLLTEQISTKDLGQQVTQQTNRIVSLQRTAAAYEKALQDPSLPAAQRVILQVRLSNVKRSLTQMRHARSGTLASAATADVALTLTTKHGALAIHHRRGRLGRMFHGAVGFLGLEGIIVIYAIVVLSPVLLIGGLLWALWRERRRREERRLLAA